MFLLRLCFPDLAADVYIDERHVKYMLDKGKTVRESAADSWIFAGVQTSDFRLLR